jgi:DNA-binding IscR family transcriptional regulator
LAEIPKAITMIQIIQAVDGVSEHLYMAEQVNNKAFSVKMEEVRRRTVSKAKTILENSKLSNILKQ